MSVLVIILGLMILIFSMIDVLVTTLTLGGSGLLTRRISHWLWKIVLQAHSRSPNHNLLATSGLMILVGVVLVWIVLAWLGWTLLFSAIGTSVVNAQSKEPADIWERIYFTGYTLFTLGTGDYQPQGVLWQILSAVASANGFFLVTLSITYLVPVVSAVMQKRQLALYITSLGGTPDEIITRAWNGQGFGQLDQHLIALTPMIIGLAESYLAYPVLHYFHSVERSKATSLSLAALDEALTLLQYGVEESYRPEPVALAPVRRATTAFLQTLKSAYIKAAPDSLGLPPLDLLRAAGIPTVSDEEFRKAIQQVSGRRQLLLALVQNDGWNWNSVASTKTTNRASTLDDTALINNAVLH